VRNKNKIELNGQRMFRGTMQLSNRTDKNDYEIIGNETESSRKGITLLGNDVAFNVLVDEGCLLGEI
jgi:hypothetical protein